MSKLHTRQRSVPCLCNAVGTPSSFRPLCPPPPIARSACRHCSPDMRWLSASPVVPHTPPGISGWPPDDTEAVLIEPVLLMLVSLTWTRFESTFDGCNASVAARLADAGDAKELTCIEDMRSERGVRRGWRVYALAASAAVAMRGDRSMGPRRCCCASAFTHLQQHILSCVFLWRDASCVLLCHDASCVLLCHYAVSVMTQRLRQASERDHIAPSWSGHSA